MITVQTDTSIPPLEGENVYTGWFLTYETNGPLLRNALGISEATAVKAEPRLMLIRVGDKGAFKVSPVTGRVLGFELFGVRITGSDILDDPAPRPRQSGALTIPLHHPYHPAIFEQGRGEAPCREPGFRQIGYRMAASRTADRFRVQFFRSGPTELYRRVANCLIAGLDEHGSLAESWLDNPRKTRQHG